MPPTLDPTLERPVSTGKKIRATFLGGPCDGVRSFVQAPPPDTIVLRAPKGNDWKLDRARYERIMVGVAPINASKFKRMACVLYRFAGITCWQALQLCLDAYPERQEPTEDNP